MDDTLNRRACDIAEAVRLPDTETRVRCLASVLSVARCGAPVHRIETHMSWVVVGETDVLKLKKPIRYPPVDYTGIEARERNARQELRQNRRLAPDIYLGLLALQWHGGVLSAVPEGYRSPAHQTIDWAVVMRRLPQGRMLDEVIRCGALAPPDFDALLRVLVPFYRDAVRAKVDEGEYVARLHHGLALSFGVLARPELVLPRVSELFERMNDAMAANEGLLRARVAEGRIVEGHGDLRPEHICLVDPPIVFDALEFDSRLSEVDPFDELCFLGLECHLAGDASLGALLRARMAAALCDTPPPALLRLYTAKNALMRARLSAAHLLEPHPRLPEKWLPQAARYLKQALVALS
jgi:aminoglycoside phosphotransferase family enzyme